jgi:membrane fusion protein, multidrug efflux system
MEKNMNKSKTRVWRFLLASLIVLAVFAIGFYLISNSLPEKKPLVVHETGVDLPNDSDLLEIKTEARNRQIEIQGRVRSENRLEIFPEVQGKMVTGDKPFREGIEFNRGETILQLDDREARLQLYSSRSGYQTLIASLLPDIKLDYPDRLEQYERWFESMDPEETLPEFPDFNHSQMERFLTSRGVYDSYYQIKSAENRLEKFMIKAPFSGVLSTTGAEPGQTVGPQSHIGTLVDPDHYLLTATVRQSLQNSISAGNRVDLTDRSGSHTWNAVVSRINPAVNSQTQSVEIYLDVEGNGIREGMFLKGVLELDEPEYVSKIPKSALLRNGTVYGVREGVIQQQPVQVVDIEHTEVWVSGLNNGERIVRDAGKALSGRIIKGE